MAFYLDASEIVGVFGAEPHVHPEIDDVQTQLIGEFYERLDIGERLGFFFAEIRSIYADLHCVPSSSVPSMKYVTIACLACFSWQAVSSRLAALLKGGETEEVSGVSCFPVSLVRKWTLVVRNEKWVAQRSARPTP